MKPVRIRMMDESGKVYRWTIQRVPRAVNCNYPTIGQSRIVSGWEFADHDGYVRFAEGNWLDLVARLKASARNYGLAVRTAGG